MLENEKLVALDIETSDGSGAGSLDPRDKNSTIALVQLAFGDGTTEIERYGPRIIEKIRSLIQDGYRFIIHNASFELDWFLVKDGIRFEKVWCTMIASQILNAGKSDIDQATVMSSRTEAKNAAYSSYYSPLLDDEEEQVGSTKVKKFSHTLQATVLRYAGVSIQKGLGTSDWSKELTEGQIKYAREDVQYLIGVAKKQWEFIKKFNLQRVVELEMETAIVVNDIKFRGILIDREQWLKSSLEYKQEADRLGAELNLEIGLELARRDGMTPLFDIPIPKPFNVASAAQLAKFFGLGNADEAALRKVEHPLIPRIMKFKEYQKISSTYGSGYLDHIMEDGRIHSLLPQTETATGRFKSRKPNLQNIPPDMLKSFLRAGDGKTLVFADYSAMESRILAYISGDEDFIRSVNSKDVHWENAKRIFGLPYSAEKTDSYEVSGKTVSGDTLRRIAKGVSFGIPYGISALGLVSRGFVEDSEEGQRLIDSFLNQYPKVAKFLKASVVEALVRGYTQDPFGRIRWYNVPRRGEAPDDIIRQAAGRAARQAQNHKIQSMSANITKQALVDLDKYFLENNSGYIVLTIHDSIIAEVNTDVLDKTVVEMKIIMEAAGDKVFPGMVVPVDVVAKPT